jgi:hypothetical protein
MAWKIVERPRWGHCARNEDVRAARHVARTAPADALEALPRMVGMGPRRGPMKHFSDFLAPLRRFVQSAVGRRWDDVYSDIRARIAPTSTVQVHVMQHLWHYVLREVEVEGERVFDGRAWRRRYELYRDGRTFYVHPVTGLLCEPARRAPPRRPPARDDLVDRGAGLLYLRRGGQWYAVTTEAVPGGPPPRDVVLHVAADASSAVERTRLYGRPGRYATSKRQLGRRALCEAGLR